MTYVLEHPLKLPERVWFGQGCSTRLPERVAAYSISRLFVVIDPVVYQTDFGRDILKALQNSISKVFVWTEVETNTPRSHVERTVCAMRLFQPDGVAVIGGGSSIDLAKTALALFVSGDDIETFWKGKPVPGPLPTILAVPTTCGTGSEATPFAVILDLDNRRKRGIESDYLIPREAFLDANALDSLPPSMVGATGMDAFCHAMEAYVSAKATPLTRCATLGAMLIISQNLQKAVLDRDSLSLEHLLVGSFMARLLYPRTGLTIAHAMSHPLGACFNLHHGEAVARVTVLAMRFNTELYPSPYADVARICNVTDDSNDVAAAEMLARWVETLLHDLQIAQNPLPTPDNDTLLFMSQNTLSSSNIPSNPRSVSLEDIVGLFSQI